MSEEKPRAPHTHGSAEPAPGHSPVVPHVVPVEMLTFRDAMLAIIDGERVTVTRIEWDDRDTYIYLGDDRLRIRKSEGISCDLIVSAGDMLATDWVVR